MAANGPRISGTAFALPQENKKPKLGETNRFQIHIHRASQPTDKNSNNNPEGNPRRSDGPRLNDSGVRGGQLTVQ
jgi:hypothetical protein